MPDWLEWTLSVSAFLVIYGVAWSNTNLSGREFVGWTFAIVAILVAFISLQQATGLSGIGLTSCIIGLISALISFADSKKESLFTRVVFSLGNGGLLVGGTAYVVLGFFF